MNDSPPHDDSFKQRDAASYDPLADEFDRFTERFTGGIAERVVDIAQLRSGENVLDVGSGTGVVAFKAAKKVGSTGRVLGIDLSDGMLRKARDKAARAGTAEHSTFQKGDAEALDLPDATFDCVLSMFALRHFPHPDVALREMRRVLKRSGRVVVAVGAAPPFPSVHFVAAVARRARRSVRALSGKRDLVACDFLNGLVEKHLPAKSAEEEAAWTHGHHLQSPVPEMMRAAGFRAIRTTWVGQDAMVASTQDFWDVQVTFSSIARKRLSGAPESAIKQLRDEFTAQCTRVLEAGGRLRYPTGALVVTGTVDGH